MDSRLRLTDHEKRMLDGGLGRLKQRALEMIVGYAEILGAEDLVEVTKAHLFVGNFPYTRVVDSEDVDEIISRIYLNCSEEKLIFNELACYGETDARMCDPGRWAEMGVEEAEIDKERRMMDRLREAGMARTDTCCPYLVGFLPMPGEHYVCTESHAIPLMNSLFQGRANADSIELSVAAAICGRTARWGCHLDSGRLGTHVFRLETELSSRLEWDLLGYVVGQRQPARSIPVLSGPFGRPDLDRLRAMTASLTTTGGAEMVHLVGLTPEAPSLEAALGGSQPQADETITQEDLSAARAVFSREGRGTVEFISLGCPHYSLAQLKKVADFLKGRRVRPGVELNVWTVPAFREMALLSGWVQTIEQAGARVLAASCPLTSDKWPREAEGLAFDSSKQAHYLLSETRAPIYIGSMEDCLRTAVSGRWEGGR